MQSKATARIHSLVHQGDMPARIIEAAAEVFSLNGYNGARVRDVVRLAEVNLAAVNYYFGGKEGLYAATVAELLAARNLMKPRDDFDVDPEVLLREHLAVLLSRSMEGGRATKLSRILAHEAMDPTPYFTNMINSSVEPEFVRLKQLVQRIARTPIPDSELDVLALSIMGQCYFYLFAAPCVRTLLKGELPGSPEVMAQKITRFALSAIRSQARWDSNDGLKEAGSRS